MALSAPFLGALCAATLLNPAVRWFQRWIGWSRRLVTLLFLFLLLGVLGVGIGVMGYRVGQEFISLIYNWDGLWDSFEHELELGVERGQAMYIRLWSMIPPQLYDIIQNIVDRGMGWLSTGLPELLNRALDVTTRKAMGLPPFLVALFIFVMATYFITADYPYLKTKAIQNLDADAFRVLGQLRVTALCAFGGYLKAQLLLSTGVFFILLAGFLLTGQPYGLLLALGLAMLDFIPLLGAGTVMAPWAVISLFLRNYPQSIRLMVILGIIVVFRRVMEPKFVGDQTGLSPVASLISIYTGMKLAGITGMILGPVVLLVFLNLWGIGVFEGFHMDLKTAIRDVTVILTQRGKQDF